MNETRVERVLRRLKIEARRTGLRQWTALCPNPKHDDRHPSWRIVDDPGEEKDGFHKCKACGFGGGLVKLVETVLKLESGVEAREWLAGDADAGLKLEEAPTLPMVVRERAPMFMLPEGVDCTPYAKWPTLFRDYLDGRGVTAEDVERWGIGYALVGRLKWRVVMVTRDREMHPLSYSARAVSAQTVPKYMTPDLGRERSIPWAIFGEQLWPIEAQRPQSTIVVTEGGFNAIAVHRAMEGSVFVGAIEGSDPPGVKLMRLAQFGTIVVLTDADDAGDKAAATIQTALGRHVPRIVRARPENGIDADTMHRLDLKALVQCAIRMAA